MWSHTKRRIEPGANFFCRKTKVFTALILSCRLYAGAQVSLIYEVTLNSCLKNVVMYITCGHFA